MDTKIFFAILSVLCGLIAFAPYLLDIFKFKTKPHIFTWLIWAITQGTATFAIFYGGGGVGGIELLVGTILILAVFLFSLKYGTKKITKTDAIVLFFALLAIIVWWHLEQPVLSVFMVSFIDIAGYIPTFRKSYRDPWDETLISWLLFAVSDIFSIFALSEYNLLTTVYLISVGSANMCLFTFCFIRRYFVQKPEERKDSIFKPFVL